MTEHFSDKSLSCPCCGESKMSPDFMEALEAFRVEYGEPIILNSAYRCPDHNLAVGGVAGSYHVLGRAADLSAPTVKQRMKFMELAKRHGLLGVGLGHNFVHLDNRTKSTFWTYR